MLILFIGSVCFGCTTPPTGVAPNRPDQPWTPAIDTKGEIVPGKAADRSLYATEFELPSNPKFSILPEVPVVDSDQVYTLPELIDIAASHNSETRIAWNNAREAALSIGIAKSAYLPRITATAVGGYLTGTGQSLSGNNPAGPVQNNITGTLSAITLRWLLFDFGTREAMLDEAKYNSMLANIVFTQAHQQLIYAVSQAFYRYSSVREHLTVAEQSLISAKAIEKAAEEKFSHGVGTRVEVAQAKQSTAHANFLVIQTRGLEENSYFDLITAMGISPATRIKIASVQGRKFSHKLSASVDKIIAEALAKRPDIHAAYAEEKISQARIRSAQAAFKPKIFLNTVGSYLDSKLAISAIPSGGGESAMVNISGAQWGGSIFAGITVPLYEGGKRRAQLSQAEINADSATNRTTRLKEKAVQQIVAANNALHTSMASYEAAQVLVAASQTAFNASLAAYENDVGSITDVNTIHIQLLNAKYALTDAYSTVLTAAATLALATGVLGSAPSQ